jgi:threonine dehydrogenase-like Zn-dependent dehydrogenase
MKQAVQIPGIGSVKCRLEDVPIPKPAGKQVLIKVVVSGSNPKDWKVPSWAPADAAPQNNGDDIAGIVEDVGPDVIAFKVCIHIRDEAHEVDDKTERRPCCSFPRDDDPQRIIRRVCTRVGLFHIPHPRFEVFRR